MDVGVYVCVCVYVELAAARKDTADHLTVLGKWVCVLCVCVCVCVWSLRLLGKTPQTSKQCWVGRWLCVCCCCS